ncbi:hypothetical protein TIFTF001_020275 [Ficus carica]|uniref:Reverse transcriptase zinc-binding domain-containing protein n=1 Tax=Ficus carica TaxID=3494 RepID=A0AA88ARF0_FICCA|nr:hypothetical protein TIFTF001_020275 [Ficus carica]
MGLQPHCDSLRNESGYWDVIPSDTVVGDVSLNAGCSLPSTFQQLFPDIASEIDGVLFSTESDVKVWTRSLDGKVTCAGAYASLIHAANLVSWGKQIWAAFIPPSRSILTWKLLHGKLPTDQALKERGFVFPSRCRFCCSADENMQHFYFSLALLLLSYHSQ